MMPETFEQVLSAAQAEGTLTPAWKKFVNTKFFVAVIRPDERNPDNFTLDMSSGRQDAVPSVVISEVRERLDRQHGLARLSGAEVVAMLGAEASILVALSDRAFNIAKDRVDWLKKGIEASREKAAAKARASAAKAPVDAPAVVVPAAAPAPVPVRRKQNGPLDVAALKPRSVTIAKIGLDFFVPGEWREKQNPNGIEFTDAASGTRVEVTGFHRPNVSLTQWLDMRASLVQHEMRYLKQAGETYPIDGADWGSRVKGMATEYTGVFPGEEAESRYLVACIRVDGTLVAMTIRAHADAFEDCRALYKWLLARVNIRDAVELAYRAPASGAVTGRVGLDRGQGEDQGEGETPGVFGMSTTGRIGRLRAMAYSLPVMLPFAVLAGLGILIFPGGTGLVVMLVMAGIITLWTCLRLMVLRLHDVNLSGKWILGFLLLAGIGGAAHKHAVIVLVLTVLFWLAAVIVYCLVPGSAGDNDYGPPPAPNTTLVKVGAGLYLVLQLAMIIGPGSMAGLKAGASGSAAAGIGATQENRAAFSPPDRSFTVELPGTPERVPLPDAIRAGFGGMTLDQYVLVSGSLRYLAQAMDYRENAPDPEAALARTQSMVIGKGVLISSRAIMLGGVEGREVRARLPDGRVRSARFVLRLLQPGGGAETQEFPCDSRARDNA